jgi:hypothetical protein
MTMNYKSNKMKKEIIKVLQKVADGELTPEQADEKLSGFYMLDNSYLCPDGDKLMQVAEQQGWVFNKGLWRKDGYRSRKTYELYAYLFL